MSEKKETNVNEVVRDKCFVIMPISDQGDYPEGHFDKVYEYIFKPAIEDAGYEPYRVDEDKLCDPIIGKIFTAIQECPMALCDLSNRNPNVLYELGIRQAYDKPVVLVKDEKTERIFDVSGINTVCYSSQRIYEDVLKNRKAITEAICATKEGKKNSIIKIVNVKNAEIQRGEVSQEDRFEVLLQVLLDDVKEIKESSVGQPNRMWFEKMRDSYVKAASETRLFGVPNLMNLTNGYKLILKKGITNKAIRKEINNLSLLTGVSIEYRREGDFLSIKIDTQDEKIFAFIAKNLFVKLSGS